MASADALMKGSEQCRRRMRRCGLLVSVVEFAKIFCVAVRRWPLDGLRIYDELATQKKQVRSK
jgi:hypothetical protein